MSVISRCIGSIKNHGRSALNGLGFDLVRTRNSHTTLDTHVANVLSSYGIDCVIDVGANTGQYGRFLRKLGFGGHIVSFEPVRHTFDQLERTASGDPLWHTYRLALGEAHESKTIHVYSSSVFASFHEATDYARETWHSLERSTEETVEVRRLDDLFDEIREKTGARNVYLKIDTQGHDRSVLAGAERTLSSLRAIQSELSMIPVYRETARAVEMLQFFEGLGFRVSGLYPINRDQKTLAVVEYDCVLVRDASGDIVHAPRAPAV